MSVVRRCTRCGHIDKQPKWRTIEEAVKGGALPPTWACPNCAWPEPELVEEGAAVETEDREPAAAKRA